MNEMTRRRFMEGVGVGAGMLCLAGQTRAAQTTAEPKSKLFVGVQVRKRSFDEHGIGTVLDDLVKTLHINAVVSIDVSKPEDIQAVAGAAAERGVRYFPAKFEWSGPGSVDAYGEKQKGNCPLDSIHGKARMEWFENVVDALPETAGGLLFGHEERIPPFHAALGWGAPGGCFCEVCVGRGKDRGVDVDRARTGFQRIHKLTQQCRSAQPPSDGAFVSLWRIFTEYPEVFTWDRLWFDALMEVRTSLRDMLRAKKPKLELGWHINHPVTMSPFFRACYDYNGYVGIADWIKPSVYHDCGGARFRSHWGGFHRTFLADLDRETALRFMYGVLNMDPDREPTLADYVQKLVRPFSEEYVARETKRGLAALKGQAKLYPGIGVDIPASAPPTPPDSVYKCVKAALDAGADGVMISRHLDEMQRVNLEAAGRAIKEHLG